MYKTILIAIAVFFFMSINSYAWVQGDDCSKISKKHHIEKPGLFICWYGTSGDDVILANPHDQNVYVNNVVAGKYSDTQINVFLGFNGNDTIAAGYGANFIFGMKGNDILSGLGASVIKGGKGDDLIAPGAGLINIIDQPGENEHDKIIVIQIGEEGPGQIIFDTLSDETIVKLVNLFEKDLVDTSPDISL